MIACYGLVSALPKRVTVVACRTSELLDRRGKQTADAVFELNDPPRAWMGLQLGDATGGSAHRCCDRACPVSDLARVNVVDVDELVG